MFLLTANNCQLLTTADNWQLLPVPAIQNFLFFWIHYHCIFITKKNTKNRAVYSPILRLCFFIPQNYQNTWRGSREKIDSHVFLLIPHLLWHKNDQLELFEMMKSIFVRPYICHVLYANPQIPKCSTYNFKNSKFIISLNMPELRLHGEHDTNSSSSSWRCSRHCCDTIYILQIPKTIPKCMVELSWKWNCLKWLKFYFRKPLNASPEIVWNDK